MTLDMLPPQIRREIRETCTDRQVEVIDLLSLGYGSKLIARKLRIQRSTAREHIEAALTALEKRAPESYAVLVNMGMAKK